MTTYDILCLVAGILGAIHGGVNVIFHGIDLIGARQGSIRALTRSVGRASASTTVNNVMLLLLNVALLALAGIVLACAIGILTRRRWGLSLGGPIAISYIAVIAVQTIYHLVLVSRYSSSFYASDRIVWLVIRCILLIAAPIYWIVVYCMKPKA